jgi:Domain of unknown function (DUF4416)
MGAAEKPTQALLFIAFMFRQAVNTDEIRAVLQEKYGAVERSFGPVPFSFTDYYKSEMGDGLQKMYLTFSRYIERDDLAAIKVFTNGIEERFSSAGSRTVNLDPGYITRDKLVLASTKDFYHRIYLSHGIFAEVTLHYRKGMFRFFSWTYPDYKDPGFLAFMEKARARLVKKLRDSP